MRDLVLEQLVSALRGMYAPSRILGRGAAAVVYLAHDQRHDRPVALKVLQQAAADPVAVERFRREIHFLAQLQHPHIVPLYDSGDAEGMLYYVTAYVEGESLRRHIELATDRRLAPDFVLRVVQEVADGLDYAHARNVLHRDVKPENILIQAGHALLADFGIARAIEIAGESVLTDTGVAIGTPAYMSPEQLSAERSLDMRSDVFALACVAYELLAGIPPFMGARGVVDNTLKFTTGTRRLSQVREGVSARLDEVFATALAFDPGVRYGTPGDFARSFREALPGP